MAPRGRGVGARASGVPVWRCPHAGAAIPSKRSKSGRQGTSGQAFFLVALILRVLRKERTKNCSLSRAARGFKKKIRQKLRFCRLICPKLRAILPLIRRSEPKTDPTAAIFFS